MAAPLTAEERRAVGDFLLFVARRALLRIVNEIEAAVRERLGDMPEPGPDTLQFLARRALYGAPARDIYAIRRKYFRLEFDRLGHYLERIGDPASLREYLLRLSSTATEREHNVGPDSTLMRDFLDLIRKTEALFHISLSPESRNMLASGWRSTSLG